MQLVYSQYDISFELQENMVWILVVENPQVLSELVEQLWRQCMGGEGHFVLSQNQEIVAIQKKLSFLVEPFSVECNSKKILTALYRNLQKDMQEEWIEERANFNQYFYRYLDVVCRQSVLPLVYDTELDDTEIFKLGGLHIDTEGVTLLERLVEYLIIENEILGYSVFVFLNLKSFLPQEDIQSLYQECFHRKIFLILIEASEHEHLEEEKTCVIDKDKCIIYS